MNQNGMMEKWSVEFSIGPLLQYPKPRLKDRMPLEQASGSP